MKTTLLILITLLPFLSYAVKPIYITKGSVKAMPIFISQFLTTNQIDETTAKQLVNNISNDLNDSGVFQTIDSSSIIDSKIGLSHEPAFDAWKAINVNFLVNGEVKTSGDGGMLIISFSLWDIYNETKILTSTYETEYAGITRLVHKISDELFEKITGDKGYYDTKIACITERGSPKNRIKQIAIMDYNGSNLHHLTDGKDLVLTPRFSPDNNKIIYLSYEDGFPRVYLYDLETETNRMIGTFIGMSFAPRFSPSGNQAAMSIAQSGYTNIYEIDFNSKKIRQVTDNYSINTSPSYSPDGKHIVFNSDRSGSKQLYIMNRLGQDTKRISHEQGSYSSPVWSPQGDYIAFIKTNSDLGFTLGVMKQDGSNERILTSGYLVESPTWSPSGRYILFKKSDKPTNSGFTKTRINRIDTTGFNERTLKMKGEASDPDWSKLLD